MKKINVEKKMRGAEFVVDYLKRQGDELPETFKGNCAMSDISSIIKASIFGFHDDVIIHVPRAIKWLDMAIEEGDEMEGADHHYTRLHQARALAGWLQDGTHECNHWDKARHLKESNWRVQKLPMKEVVDWELSDYMAFAILGDGESAWDVEPYEAGIQMYEYWRRPQEISLKKTLKPYDFGYAVCKNLAHQEFDGDELLEAGHKMLKANLENWIASGQANEAAMWLMIINWFLPYYLSSNPPKERPTPLETLLMAYADMPDVKAPFKTEKDEGVKGFFKKFLKDDDG